MPRIAKRILAMLLFLPIEIFLLVIIVDRLHKDKCIKSHKEITISHSRQYFMMIGQPDTLYYYRCDQYAKDTICLTPQKSALK